MFTDIVGYTALMGSDEQKTFEILDKNRAIHKPIIAEYNGRWIKELGDGVMASFNNVSDAVHAAIKIQETCNRANDYQLSIGIHAAEVVFENDDVFGNGVNIAARIQAAAPAGGIFISEEVYHNIANNKKIKALFVKEQNLKNVSKAIRLYQVLYAGGEIVQAEVLEAPTKEKSIAVLPFVNMSSDPEQEYFSDGISEEIINMLAQVQELKVIGRTSSFAFKGQNINLKVIGEQLNVTHILEGSVRKAGNKLRVTAQLIEVSHGFHLYSEKFDRELEDIFAIQDEISEAILNATKIKLFGEPKETIGEAYSDNVKAYELYLKGRYHVHKFTPDGSLKAIEFFDAAIAIDANYALAYAGLTFCYTTLKDLNWLASDQAIPLARQAAHKALQLDDKIAEGHMAVGRILLHQDWKITEALKAYEKALALSPNSSDAHVQTGMCLVLLGQYDKALEHARKAETLDPFSILNLWFLTVVFYMSSDFAKTRANGERILELEPDIFSGHMWVGLALLSEKKFREAIPALQSMVKQNPGPHSLCFLGVAYGLSGNRAKAREIIEEMREYEFVEETGNYFLGIVYMILGDSDTAFHYLERAVEHHEGQVLWIQFFILMHFPELEKDHRTEDLLRKMGIPKIKLRSTA